MGKTLLLLELRKEESDMPVATVIHSSLIIGKNISRSQHENNQRNKRRRKESKGEGGGNQGEGKENREGNREIEKGKEMETEEEI